jgi:hypothetical protein
VEQQNRGLGCCGASRRHQIQYIYQKCLSVRFGLLVLLVYKLSVGQSIVSQFLELPRVHSRVKYFPDLFLFCRVPRRFFDYMHSNDNRIGTPGAIALASAVSRSTSLKELLMLNNLVGEPGLNALALAWKSNRSLVKLELGVGHVDEDEDDLAAAAAAAVAGAPAPVKVPKDKEEKSGELVKNLAAAMAASTVIRELTLTGLTMAKGTVGVLAAAIKDHPTLTCLALTHNHLNDAVAVALSQALKTETANGMGRLRTLSLAHNEIGDVGIAAVADVLKSNAVLVDIDLASNQIGVWWCVLVCEEVLPVLVAMFWCFVSQWRFCKTPCASSGHAPCAVISYLVSIFWMSVGPNTAGDAGAQALAGMLRSNTTLATLTLTDNIIGDTGVVHLGRALRENRTCCWLAGE